MDTKHEKIWRIAKNKLSTSAHGVSHTKRVHALCKKLADHDTEESILLPAALLHDIARAKEDEDDTGEIDHAVLGAEKAEKILTEENFEKEKIEEIQHCIRTHRFRGNREPETLEAKILSDADKLDAIGAVGIGRMFMLAGEFKEKIYRDVKAEKYVENNMTENGRVVDISQHSPNLEYELKLKKIPDRLYTDKAKKIGEDRIAYMDCFFDRLEEEIEGK